MTIRKLKREYTKYLTAEVGKDNFYFTKKIYQFDKLKNVFNGAWYYSTRPDSTFSFITSDLFIKQIKHLKSLKFT